MHTRSHQDMSTAPQRAPSAPDKARRRALVFGLGALGTPAIVKALPGTIAAETSATQSQAQGYQETEHVRDYYASARI
jgi:hypothetical protein